MSNVEGSNTVWLQCIACSHHTQVVLEATKTESAILGRCDMARTGDVSVQILDQQKAAPPVMVSIHLAEGPSPKEKTEIFGKATVIEQEETSDEEMADEGMADEVDVKEEMVVEEDDWYDWGEIVRNWLRS